MKIIDPLPKIDINMFDRNDLLTLASKFGSPVFEYNKPEGTWFLVLLDGKTIGSYLGK